MADPVTVRFESSVPSIETVVPSTATPVVALMSTFAAEVMSTSPEFEEVTVTPVWPSTKTDPACESIVTFPLEVATDVAASPVVISSAATAPEDGGAARLVPFVIRMSSPASVVKYNSAGVVFLTHN